MFRMDYANKIGSNIPEVSEDTVPVSVVKTVNSIFVLSDSKFRGIHIML